MTCEHQWHDATTKSGPEWICARCKSKYSELKKVYPTSQRTWVGLTDDELYETVRAEGRVTKADAWHIVENLKAKLKENT